jgi:hypothetical protein
MTPPDSLFRTALCGLLLLAGVGGADPATAQSVAPATPETHHADIDRVRQAVRQTPTDSKTLAERLSTLKLWIRLLSFSGANLNPLRDHYTRTILDKTPNETGKNLTQLIQAVDYEYGQLEQLFADFAAHPDRQTVKLERQPAENTGEVRDWFTLRGDEGQTGYTTQPGPMQGKLKWKFPAGHAWYATPAFADGKVFIGSPGVSYEAYCLDAETGRYVWKTRQKENQNQYRTPASVRPRSSSAATSLCANWAAGAICGRLRSLCISTKKPGRKQKKCTRATWITALGTRRSTATTSTWCIRTAFRKLARGSSWTG